MRSLLPKNLMFPARCCVYRSFADLFHMRVDFSRSLITTAVRRVRAEFIRICHKLHCGGGTHHPAKAILESKGLVLRSRSEVKEMSVAGYAEDR
ncbi:hypothetical protein B0T14DRAFT_238415 [Immersiella caudata]|uniref:Uncharacterized protein n=1 Tax=Immersiella caudata TaxID=314043 RepID=A0AA40C0J9_9PEZI|nr:hypothetical protein B0T14DRAFT_238415 [Immersiella caudata]